MATGPVDELLLRGSVELEPRARVQRLPVCLIEGSDDLRLIVENAKEVRRACLRVIAQSMKQIAAPRHEPQGLDLAERTKIVPEIPWDLAVLQNRIAAVEHKQEPVSAFANHVERDLELVVYLRRRGL